MIGGWCKEIGGEGLLLLSLVDYVSALVHVKICKIIRICTIGN